MKKLKNISVFKIILFSIIATIFNNLYLYLLLFLFLILNNYFDSLFYAILIIILIFISNFNYDFIPYGIIESKKSSYYIVDKFLYKEKLVTENDLNIGDIIYSTSDFKPSNDENELIKNIKYYVYSCKKIGALSFKSDLYDYIHTFKNDTKNSLLKFLYNINEYDDLSINLGYSFSLYLLFRIIYKRNKVVGVVSLFVYSLLFYFNLKFYLLFIDFVLSFINLKNIDKFSIKILLIFILNRYLLMNNSILIPLLISLNNLFDLNLSFRLYFSLIQSFIFGEINLISSFFYKYYFYFQIYLIILSFILLFLPFIEPFYILCISLFSYLNNLSLIIRGSVSLISLFILWFTIQIFNINNNHIIFILLILLISSPLNNPFGHISFIDVGQGDSILIQLPLNNGNVLIDTGSKYNYYKLKKYLYKQGIYKIDYLIITHNDSDHNGNLESLQNDFIVNEIITEGKDLNLNNLTLKYYYLDDFDNDNDNSLVYGIKINNMSYLFTGDISKLAEKIFVNKYGPIHFDVLKVSHHGSYTGSSSYFIENILPKYAIISTSGLYNHPAESTIETLNNYLVDYFITKDDKNIVFYIFPGFNMIHYAFFKFVIIR